ncbi:sugar kinase [Paracoccus aerodenitrificans]|uniref:sugar kinase n=1 Tax=Paracoccus aerodenitrificans TaxID=3017781 RepID=UPI0022F04380|nr:sugar kinase [Paracoccus aerodenitrificans]WBU64209.1 sugar kinase [Paracoccus aerodenitrificans]
MANHILSIGEAMIELSQPGGNGLWQLGIAGDTLNTAWYLRRLLPADRRVDYFTRVGTGEFSRRMTDFLRSEGIGTGFVGRDPEREIGLYAISLENGERSFSYWRDNSAARWLADDPETLRAALAGCAIAYFSGITLAILSDQGRKTLLEALAVARKQGSRIVFDTNLRPRLWPDIDTMRQYVQQAASHADLILPSFDDEREFFGDSDPETTLARYLRLGAKQVIVKAGGAAVHFAGAEDSGVVGDLPRDRPVDTTAAGDSFNAGYLAARIRGETVPDAIRSAHVLSRKVIGHSGALVWEAVI